MNDNTLHIGIHECAISVNLNRNDPDTKLIITDFTHLPEARFAELSVFGGYDFAADATWELIRNRLLDTLYIKVIDESACNKATPGQIDMTLEFVISNDDVHDAMATIVKYISSYKIDCGVVPL